MLEDSAQLSSPKNPFGHEDANRPASNFVQGLGADGL